MIRLKSILSGFAMAAALSACGSSGDEPVATGSISPAVETVTFSNEGGSQTVAVTSSGEWDAYTTDAWIKLQKVGTTKTEGSVIFTVDSYSGTDARAGSVIFMCGSARASVEVRQNGRAPEPVDTSIEVPEGYSLVWHDEFDKGSELDAAHWRHEVQGSGWVNNELQNYVNGAFNGQRVTELVDGKLQIHCFKAGSKVYSGRVYAHEGEGWKYGIFEARINLPSGRGTWPAFWMMPVNNDFGANPWPRCGEIDIMEEVGTNPDYTSSSIHCERYNHTIGTQKTAERLCKGAEGEFHVYRLEWTPEYIKTYVDGKSLFTFRNDGAGDVATWPFDKPFYIILNLAWGGSWGGMNGVDEAALPATMQVDYVRVFQKNS